MKIAIDALPLMMPKTGIGFYTYHLLSEFIKIAPENDYYLCDILWGNSVYNLIKIKKGPPNTIEPFRNISKIPFPLQPIMRIGLLSYTKLFGEAWKIEEMDLFFGPNFRGIFRKMLKTVITIHDMAHEYYPENVEPRVFHYLKKELNEAAKGASLIIADSQNTKKDILKFLNINEEKVKVIYIGVDETFRPIRDPIILDLARKKYYLPEKFILYLGALQPRKNIAGLIRAYNALSQSRDFKHHLVIAGGVGWKNQDVRRLIDQLKLWNKITFTGYIAPSDLPIVYNLADTFVFPSFYEGFGLPVLEAMACGVPVITSNGSSLPEVAGDAAVLINPHSVDDLANGIRQMLSDETLREKYINRGLERTKLFTWERCARETLKLFDEVMCE